MALLPVAVDPQLAQEIAFFVYRTEYKGVPRRVALKRAQKRFKLPLDVIRESVRSINGAEHG